MSAALKDNPIFEQRLKPFLNRIRKIDGSHPLKYAVPEACIEYPVRIRKGGKIAFFNYTLAKEMGLIPPDYPEVMDPLLEKTLLETFGLQIINEYDQKKGTRFNEADIKPNRYMATRYLQLQHPNKQGLTSGDGRSLWNGFTEYHGKTWDISSCGTGATRLSPACAIHKKNFRTGDPFVAYGCGRATLSEGLSAALMSEVFSRNGIPTERTLLLIDYGRSSINVRAAQNLIRPSHMFRFLKQARREPLTKLVRYFQDRQMRNHGAVAGLADQMAEDFARATARFESEYIFCWLDWDGDNILASQAGIIDYGSVRQFGLFHKEYRYDDVDRFSTSLLEQKKKGRETVQAFCQLEDFLKTGKRKPFKRFEKAKSVRLFDKNFQFYKKQFLLEKIGLPMPLILKLIGEKKTGRSLRKFENIVQYFEYRQSGRGSYLTSDGKTSDAVFSIRDIFRELPKLLMARQGQFLEDENFLAIAASSYARPRDLVLSQRLRKKIKEFQKRYIQILKSASELGRVSFDKILLEVLMRSSVQNRYERITGDGILCVTQAVLRTRKKMPLDRLMRNLQLFFRHQSPLEFKKDHANRDDVLNDSMETQVLSQKLIRIVRENRDGI
jgi:hypothetical protein